MDEARWQQVQSLFHAALEREPEGRQAFLETACAADRELLQCVSEMLRADEEAKSLLDRGLPDVAADLIENTLHDPAHFQGPEAYRLKRILGEGGMGVVWLADRKDAGNPVAIKFLPNALMSVVRRQRFAAEIKTLAKLKHPFIARFYDAGNLTDGTPWFAMEYVDGVALIEYCQTRKLAPADCLRLMRSICDAVQYAHGQEIIHRDLKPSNILVEPNGAPKLLDFGIARELQGLEQESGLTRPGLRMLTPEYAAPEWMEHGALGFFTDVYSLGVLLFEMLHGKRPEEQDRQVESDLDRLCMKAGEKGPAERYGSVEAFARDIDHYLRGEPLDAHPYSLRYRVAKFVTRNRKPVLAALAMMICVLTLAGIFVWRLARAREAAEVEAARTQRVEQFMLGLFEGGDKGAGAANSLRVITLLDHGALDAQALDQQPAIQAEVFRTLGRSYQALGEFDKAQALLTSALQLRRGVFGRESGEFAESELELGLLQIARAQLPEAEKTIRNAMTTIGKRYSDRDPWRARATSALAQVFQAHGKYKEAIPLFNAAIRIQSGLGAGKADLAGSLNGLGDSWFEMGEYSKARPLYQSAFELHEQLYGEHHPRVAEDLRNLGNVQTQFGKYVEAEQLFRRALAIDQTWYGENHPETANLLSYVGQSLMYQKKYGAAETIYARALVATEEAYGKSHPKVALVLAGLTGVHMRLGKGNEGIAEAARAFEIDRSALGEEHLFTVIALSNLASGYMELKQYGRAEPIFRRAIALYNKIQSPQSLNSGIARMKLGRTLLGEGRFREASTETLASYGILSKATQPSNGWLQADRRDLIKEYAALHEPEKGERYRKELAANSH